MELKDIIIKPIITEKSSQAEEKGRYSFKVDKRANKRQISRAIEQFFGVHVSWVRTITMRGKKKRIGRYRREIKSADWKKAIIQLAEGEKIDFLPGGEKK